MPTKMLYRLRCLISYCYFAVRFHELPPWSAAYVQPPFWSSRPAVKLVARLLGFRVGWSPAEVAQLQAYAATIETGA